MHDLPAQLLIGIQLGSIYALIALGYTMVYGVLKLINFAHGDVYMVGAYAGLGAAAILGGTLASHAHSAGIIPSPEGALLVLLVSMLLCGLLGLVIEEAAYRPLRTRAWRAPAVFLGAAAGYIADRIAADAGLTTAFCLVIGIAVWIGLAALLRATQQRKTLETSRLTSLITAIGVSLFLENFTVLPQIFGSEPRYFPTIIDLPPAVRSDMIFLVSLVLMGILTLVVTRTKIGKAVRAVSFDSDAAALMGINTNTVISFTFALGAALAGAAGVLVFSLQGTNFDTQVGVEYGLKAFVAAVLGGIGNIPGAMLGGLIMGVAETMVNAYGPNVGIPSTYRDAVAFFLLILILLVRPAGLLGKFAPEKV
jgi:branched-chain amino acid transport system permease protein